ncbi:acylphosphatase [Paramesorhizobium deserti]|uniref:Acylphosphatase n=1 Tax=Paramesorhizobium deserti TaxID=1494590 RepID=A0A135HRU0_9HYPH|nr:acylphosphatase [Paramesorhizobium deserti]KXF75902.1 acylphosphatase [Paramesorhizobium deserti]
MTEQHHSHFRERMIIHGELDATSFIPWIQRHAAKLGLWQAVSHTSSDRIELELAGPPDLIDMMEMGCSLGPIDVWVETIYRTPLKGETN